MPVDRKQWLTRFDDLPGWQCPTCKMGHLVSAPDKVWVEETGPSLAARDHDAWDPDWIHNRFAGFLKCTALACGEIVSVSGDGPTDFIEYQDEYEHTQELKQLYEVRSLEPTPLPIQLPPATPEQVEERIVSASGVIWRSSEAAGNAIRQALELMLDDQGVTSTDANGKPISLHQRITAFAQTDQENGAVLLAIKWLGNSGSHPGGLSRDDVLDAFDMLEYVLEARYGTAKADLLAKVAAVNAEKGPV